MKSVRFSTLWKVFVSAAVAGLFVSCNKNNNTPDGPVVVPDPEPAEGINNQLQYNSAELIDIKSVVCTENDETEIAEFYLSPVEGITTIEEVLATNDYLYVKTAFLSDDQTEVDTTGTFELSYKDLKVTNSTLTGNEHKVKITLSWADAVSSKTEWSHKVYDGLTINVDYINDAEQYLFARYTGSANACIPLVELDNQYILAEDKENVVYLQSVVGLDYEEYGLNYWLFYQEEGIKEYSEDYDPVITIVTPGEDETLDLSSLAEGYAVSVEGWGEAASGKLVLKSEKGKLTLSGNGVDESGQSLRVKYEGPVTYTYYSDNSFYQPDDSSVELFSVFREKYGNASYYYAFGSNFNAETPEELKDGHYALFLEVPQSAVDTEIDEENFVFPEGFKAYLYDYETYTTYEWSADDADEYSRIVVKSEPNGKDDKVYIRYDLIFTDAEGEEINIYMTAYLDVVDTTIPDLTPVKPFSPKITITSEAGETLLDWDITAMQVRHQPAKSDIRDAGGSKLAVSAYSFYFINKNTESSGVDSEYATPVFSLAESCVNTLDEKQLNGSDVVWSFSFQNSNFSQTSYGDVTNASKYGIYRCPDDVKLTVKKEDKDWTFKLVFKDWGAFGTSFSGAPTTLSGTKNVVTIEWRGPATKYTGSKKNDLTDEDY